MKSALTFQLFWRTSRVERKRAVLTAAAIAFGSASLVLLLAFGKGMGEQWQRGSSAMGTDIAVFWPGETTMPWQGMPAGRPIRPRIEDIRLVQDRVPGLLGISGEMRSWRTAFTYGDRTVNGRLTGAGLAFGWLRNHVARRGGRFLNPLDDAQRRRVVFLGFALAEDIFGSEEPVGRTLLINQVPYTVVGVMIEKMQMNSYGGMDKDHAVIPLRTFYAQVGRDRLSNIVIRPEDPARMKEILHEVRRVLGAKYGFDPDDERALGAWDTIETSAIFRNMTLGIQLFLSIIGGLTLASGGVGVANIMYAVVKERTREIGVKMALGARSAWITGPIVLEGLTYTLLGGVLGLLIAVAIIALTVFALSLVPSESSQAVQMLGQPTLSVPIALTTAGVLGIIGLLAGYFPARRAAAVDPAQTLRYE